ncbi:MAG: ABC transporter substrate-binding protein, partial [Nitrospinota bacterium]
AKTGKYQQEAFQMWDEEVNKRGGLVGRPVCLIHYDDQSDPEKSVELYEKLITEDKVALVLGPCSSAVTNPVAGVTEKYQSPMITAFTVGAAQPEFVAELGDLAEYTYGASQWEPDPRLPSPEQREWVERYTNRWGREPDHHAASGWAACQVMEACIKQVGSLDREQLRDCLSETEMMPIHGPCKVDAGTGEQRGHEILLIQWQNGKKEIVYPAKYASAKPAHPTPPWGER